MNAQRNTFVRLRKTGRSIAKDFRQDRYIEYLSILNLSGKTKCVKSEFSSGDESGAFFISVYCVNIYHSRINF